MADDLEAQQRSSSSDWDAVGTSKKEDDYASYLASNPSLLLLLCTLVCGFIGACLAYLVFGIIFLIDDENVCGDSDARSNLWVYALVVIAGSVAFSCLMNVCLASSNPYDVSVLKLRVGLTIAWMIAMVVYGLYVLYVEGICDNLFNTGLYVWVQVAIYVQLVSSVLFIVLLWVYWDAIVAMMNTNIPDNEETKQSNNNSAGLDGGNDNDDGVSKTQYKPEEAQEGDSLLPKPTEDTPLLSKSKVPQDKAPERDPSKELD